jgi:hypothetical protein
MFDCAEALGSTPIAVSASAVAQMILLMVCLIP